MRVNGATGEEPGEALLVQVVGDDVVDDVDVLAAGDAYGPDEGTEDGAIGSLAAIRAVASSLTQSLYVM